MGNLLAVHIHAANIHDTKSGIYTFEKAIYKYSAINGVCADYVYHKYFKNIIEEFYNIKVDISKRLESTFKVMPTRWKVERTFVWLCHSGRLSKDYEIRTIYAETMVIISHLHTLLKRFYPIGTSSYIYTAKTYPIFFLN